MPTPEELELMRAKLNGGQPIPPPPSIGNRVSAAGEVAADTAAATIFGPPQAAYNVITGVPNPVRTAFAPYDNPAAVERAKTGQGSVTVSEPVAPYVPKQSSEEKAATAAAAAPPPQEPEPKTPEHLEQSAMAKQEVAKREMMQAGLIRSYGNMAKADKNFRGAMEGEELAKEGAVKTAAGGTDDIVTALMLHRNDLAKNEDEVRRQRLRQQSHEELALNQYEEQSKAARDQAQTIDPNRYWNDKSTGSKILLILGGAMAGFVKDEGYFKGINDAVNRDVDAQKYAADATKRQSDDKLNAYKMLRGQGMDDAAATAQAQAIGLRKASAYLDQIEKQNLSDAQRQELEKLRADLKMQYATLDVAGARAQLVAAQNAAAKAPEQPTEGDVKQVAEFADKLNLQKRDESVAQLTKRLDKQIKEGKGDEPLEGLGPEGTMSAKLSGIPFVGRALRKATSTPTGRENNIFAQQVADAEGKRLSGASVPPEMVKGITARIANATDANSMKAAVLASDSEFQKAVRIWKGGTSPEARRVFEERANGGNPAVAKEKPHGRKQ